MQLNLGQTIKKLRNQRNMTQEQLAEYLNVSISAVSQWESGKTVPDITTVISLANFFDISLDALFNRSNTGKESDLIKYSEKAYMNRRSGKIPENVGLWKEATQKYPGDCLFLTNLADALAETLYTSHDKDVINASGKECIRICEQILKDCTDSKFRHLATETLVAVYSYGNAEFTDEEKALQYAESAPALVCSREILRERAYIDPAKKQEAKDINTIDLLHMVTSNISYNEYTSPTDRIAAYKTVLKLWEILIYDGNYLDLHAMIENTYTWLAFAYAEILDKENTLDALKKALYHAECYDNLPHTKQKYTSIYVSSAYYAPRTDIQNQTVHKDEVLHMMSFPPFEFLKNDPEFIGLRNS